MKRALVTGANGFVGSYLTNELLLHKYEVFGGTRSGSPILNSDVKSVAFKSKDLMNVLENIKPTVLFHLSGQSSVIKSWNHIEETFDANLMNTIQLLDAVKNSSLRNKLTIVTVGSSEEYGLVQDQPITEESVLNPMNPYGLSKMTMGKIATLYNKTYEMKVIHVRPFNHIGPGQSLGFVTSDFAKQVADIEQGFSESIIRVGDLSSKRDFTDVRDIVKAYRMVAEKGQAGEVYNVCSGECVPIQLILDSFLTLCSKDIKVEIDRKRMRPSDIAEYYGSNKKINDAVGWAPKIPLNQSLEDIYSYWLNMK